MCVFLCVCVCVCVCVYVCVCVRVCVCVCVQTDSRVGQNHMCKLCTVYDRIFDDFPAKNTVYIPYIYVGLVRTVYLHCV